MSDKKLNMLAMKLPPKRRAILAEQLLASLDDEAEQSIDAAWAKEAENRIRDFEAGKSRSKPIAKVMSKLRNRAKP